MIGRLLCALGVHRVFDERMTPIVGTDYRVGHCERCGTVVRRPL